MPVSDLRLIKRCVEFRPKTEIGKIPGRTRGIYVLFNKRGKASEDVYEVVYIGMARGTKSGMNGRLHAHARGKNKDRWTHFSIFEVWDNIREEEVVELEGVLRHVYRKDARANPLNEQRKFMKLKTVGKVKLENWSTNRQ
jgi:hypothetical protein